MVVASSSGDSSGKGRRSRSRVYSLHTMKGIYFTHNALAQIKAVVDLCGPLDVNSLQRLSHLDTQIIGCSEIRQRAWKDTECAQLFF